MFISLKPDFFNIFNASSTETLSAAGGPITGLALKGSDLFINLLPPAFAAVGSLNLFFNLKNVPTRYG